MGNGATPPVIATFGKDPVGTGSPSAPTAGKGLFGARKLVGKFVGDATLMGIFANCLGVTTCSLNF